MMNKCAYKPDCPWYDGTKCNSPNDHTYNECDYDRGIFPEREEERREQDAPDTNAGDTISRQAAIEAIEFGITYAKAIDKETGEVKELFQEGNNELRKAAERVKALPPARPEQRWIPFTERPPKKRAKVPCK